ncbi:AP-3 complex subunit delta [Thecaphora frezii]
MFERSLSALIKGLRSHRGKDEAKYVAQVMDEIRHEVRSGDMEVKAEAVLKLTYLQMLGYPFSNASFHMLEIMASPRYHLKHIGYLAAAQCFSQDTDVLILATNMIKKDLHSTQPLDIAVALNGLSHIVTPDLSRHLGPDAIALLTHSRPLIRKKALLVLYSMIIKCPEMLGQAWDRLRDKLDDPDLGVVSAAVNIICELARRDPRPFVPLSPQLFHLLTTSTNNWMLIKVIKLFGALTPLEPRLVRKLVPPITTIISNTPAMSLLYECIHTVITGGMLSAEGGDSLADTCVEKLARFLEDADQNLKYISLLALVKILPTHPHLVAEHKDTILQSIEDPDLSIRLRALELVSGMVSSWNLQPIVSQLMSHLEPPSAAASASGSATKTSAAAAALKASLSGISGGGGGLEAGDPSTSAVAAAALNNNPTLSPSYRLEIVRRILTLGSANTYANVQDFQWYLDVLVRLALIANVPEDEGVGARIRDQIIDITSRVRAVRPYAARTMVELLRDQRLAGASPSTPGLDEGRDMRKVLHAAAWVCGEYCEDVPAAATVIPLLLQPSIYQSTDATTAAVCIHNAIKLFAHWTASLSEEWSDEQLEGVQSLSRRVIAALDQVQKTTEDAEVQERTTEFRQLFRLLERDLDSYRASGSKPPVAVAAGAPAAGQNGQAPSEAAEAEVSSAAPAAPEAPMGEPPGSLDVSRAPSPQTPGTPTAGSGPKGPKSLNLLSPLFFNHTLGPVAEKAQSKVPVPEGLELEAWIVQQDWLASLSKAEDGFEGEDGYEGWMHFDFYRPESRTGRSRGAAVGAKKKPSSALAAQQEDAERERRRREREERLRDDPFYIGTKPKSSSRRATGNAANGAGAGAGTGADMGAGATADEDIDSIPIVRLDLGGLQLGAASSRATPSLGPPVLEKEEMPERNKASSKASGTAATKVVKKKKKKPTAAIGKQPPSSSPDGEGTEEPEAKVVGSPAAAAAGTGKVMKKTKKKRAAAAEILIE